MIFFNCPVPTLIRWIACSTVAVFCISVPTAYYATWKAFDELYKDEIPYEHEFHPEDGWNNPNFIFVGQVIVATIAVSWVLFLIVCVCCCCYDRRQGQQQKTEPTYVLINTAPTQV
jgi:hypothetical protein